MTRQFFARSFAHPSTLGVLLLVTLLALSGCGGSRPAGAEATIAPTSTLVATMVAPATPVVAAPVATAEPTATESPSAESTVEATAEMTDAEAVTETVTADEETTGEEPITATGELTQTEESSATTEVTGASPEITATVEITSSTEITASAEVTAAERVTGDAHMDAGDAMTGTTAFSPSAELTSTTAISGLTSAPDAHIHILQPTTNAIVPVTFTVVVSATGVNVQGNGAADAGHLHLLIDSNFIEPGETVPADEQHRLIPDGENSIEISLPPGSHTLRLQYASSDHTALEGEQYRHEIIVSVVEGAPETSVRFAAPSTGAIVPPIFEVVMAAAGISVEPAGVVNEDAGHFHLLLDEPFVPAGEIIPADETHLHFGKAQLTTTLTLDPGSYLLRLQVADGTHRALSGNEYRAEITVLVEEGAEAQQVMFVKPADGALLSSPFVLGWAASGLIIEPAGSVMRPEGGHLHLLINEEFVAGGDVIPADETHLHFGKAQTSTELTLEPGEYTLRLQMATGTHSAQDGPQYQDEITVTVR